MSGASATTESSCNIRRSVGVTLEAVKSSRLPKSYTKFSTKTASEPELINVTAASRSVIACIVLMLESIASSVKKLLKFDSSLSRLTIVLITLRSS